jgi:hypothetical protein
MIKIGNTQLYFWKEIPLWFLFLKGYLVPDVHEGEDKNEDKLIIKHTVSCPTTVTLVVILSSEIYYL